MRGRSPACEQNKDRMVEKASKRYVESARVPFASAREVWDVRLRPSEKTMHLIGTVKRRLSNEVFDLDRVFSWHRRICMDHQ